MFRIARLLFVFFLLAALLLVAIAAPEKCSDSFDCTKTVFGVTQCIKGECVTIGGGGSDEAF